MIINQQQYKTLPEAMIVPPNSVSKISIISTEGKEKGIKHMVSISSCFAL